MTLAVLRALAETALGERLERLTPETLAEFLSCLQTQLPGTQTGGVVVVEGAPVSYEAAMREYFAEMLATPPDRAAASLWVTAAEMWLGAMEAEGDGQQVSSFISPPNAPEGRKTDSRGRSPRA